MGFKDSGGVCKPGWSTKVRSEDNYDSSQQQKIYHLHVSQIVWTGENHL